MIFSEKLSPQAKSFAERFFLGLPYPAFVGAVVLIGYVTGFEFYLNAINLLLLTFGILATSSILPAIPCVAMFLFQISMVNSPEEHVGSTFYHDPLIIGITAALFLAVLCAVIYVLVTTGRLTKTTLAKLPFPLATALLTSAFLINGALIPEWGIENTLYGGLLALEYFLLFYLFSLGFLYEEKGRLVDYLVFTGAISALVLSAETAHLYLTNDALFAGGEIVKEQVVYGWGMWTMAGQFLAVTIPLCFLGIMRGSHRVLNFVAATLALVSAAMTLSRNALLIAGSAYLASAVACCFIGRSKRAFRIILPIFAILGIAVFIIFFDKIYAAFADFFRRGLSDNGRFELWAHGIKSFLEAPIFGKGFFGIQRELFQGCTEGFSFYPRMMHNTPIQLLGSMGIFGFLAYGYYRFKTVIPLIKSPSLEKTMLGASILVMIVGSLIDNFLFLFKHMLFYPILLAAIFRLAEKDETEIYGNLPN